MFASKQRSTVIAKGLKIVGRVTAEGLVEINGQIEGELHCTSLIISRQAHVVGTIQAERVCCGRDGGRPNSRQKRRSEVASTCRGRYSPSISRH